jgi:hypothetical protein
MKIDRKRYVQIIALGALLALSLAMSHATPAMETVPIKHERPVQEVSLLASITLAPTGDTTVQEAHPTTNYGNSSSLILGRIDGGRARALIKFNIGEIPLGATINSATLRIYQHGWGDDGGSVRTIFADCATSAWHEAVATWNYAPTIGATAGSVSVGMSEGWYEINVTTLVRDWYTGTTSNHGLLLRGYEGSGNLYRLFVPRLYVDEPQLVVDYTLQPTTLGVSTNAISFLTDGHKTLPSTSIVRVINHGTGVMNWSIDLGSTSWLEVSPTSGSTSASYRTPVEVSIVTDTLSVGTHTAELNITASGAQSSPQTVDVVVNCGSDLILKIYLPLIMRSPLALPPNPSADLEIVALLIGIADYQNLDPLPTGSERTGDWGNDLEEANNPPHFTYEAVEQDIQPHNARIVKDAEAYFDNLEELSESWVREREKGVPKKVVWTYTGHGGQDASGVYLITAHDTDESGGYFSNAISGTTLDGWMDNWESPLVFVDIDACRSGGLLPELSQSGRVVVTSARSDQSAWETNEFNGTVFTHYLVQGLMDPSADTNGDGCVSAEEAFTYAAGRTDSYVYSHTGYHQNPQIYDGVTDQLCLTRLPPYGPMVAGSTIMTDEAEQLDAIFFSRDPIPLPVTVIPLR